MILNLSAIKNEHLCSSVTTDSYIKILYMGYYYTVNLNISSKGIHTQSYIINMHLKYLYKAVRKIFSDQGVRIFNMRISIAKYIQ